MPLLFIQLHLVAFRALTDAIRYPGGSTLGLFGWGCGDVGCAAGTLEPLVYTRYSSSEFCYPILD